ncbi:hypothetical protein [Burkholderia ambifaria]|uniref:hypothetical protein n=1 Tax=Burkholderia ambifaria TaxID=152480 RepID=UPI00315CE851
MVQMYGSLANMLSGNVSVYRSVWALKMNGTTSPSCPPPTKGLSPGIYSCNVLANIVAQTPAGEGFGDR